MNKLGPVLASESHSIPADIGEQPRELGAMRLAGFKIGHRWLRHTWIWVAVLLPTLIMSPVLLWPHYGLFSDAGQAITFPRLMLDEFPRSLLLLRPMEDGRWNPLFHGLTVLIYAINPDSARAFYVAQWAMFVASSLSVAWILARLTGSKWYALLGCTLFCTASSISENFYTLDKVEPRVTLFSALIITSLVARFIAAPIQISKNFSWQFVIVQSVLGVWLVFSKETGVYLAAAVGCTWLACLFNSQWEKPTRKLFRETFLIQGAVMLVFMALFKALSMSMTYRYVTYDVTLSMVTTNVSYYLKTSPELALGLLCAVYWCLSAVWKSMPCHQRSVQPLLVFLSICELSYFAGISLWRWPLDYYLLPAHYLAALLVPLTIWALLMRHAGWSRLVLRATAWLGAALWCGFLGFRLFVGFAIYAQDALKDDLALYLSSSDLHLQRMVLPLAHPDNAEVGERLKFFINRNLPEGRTIDLFNFWEPAFVNRQNLQRFNSGAGIAPQPSQLAEVAQHPERYVMWQFGANAETDLKSVKHSMGLETAPDWRPDMPWRADYLRQGNLIVVPAGSHLFQNMRSRGLSMYSTTVQDFLRKTPLQLTYLGGVHRSLHFASMSWNIFRVENILTNTEETQGYSLSNLLMLNAEIDITPIASTEALFGQHRYAEKSVLLGKGWYGVEQEGGSRFRWMGANGDVVLAKIPVGACSLFMDVEPLLAPESEVFSLNLVIGTDKTEFQLMGRNTVKFNFTSSGEKLQIINVYTRGGFKTPPKSDPRLLKIRAFSVKLLQCEGTVQQPVR